MRRVRMRWLVPWVAVVAASALVAGCGSAGGGSGGSGTGSSGGGAADPVGVAKAVAQVAKLSAVTTRYPVPRARVSGVSAVRGRTVYYVPLVQQIPGFVVTARAMRQALAKAGLSLQVCNGEGQPSAIAACVQQAVGAGAAGIVLDAIPYGMVPNALDAAKAKGVPIVVAHQYPMGGAANSNRVSYVPGVVDQPSQIAWWIIADSRGKANLIIAEDGSSPSAKQFVTDSLSIYQRNCPGCAVSVKLMTASTPALLASATSSNILANPGATYYYTEFEDSLQPTVQGIQQSGRPGILLSVAGGSVYGLGLLKSGTVKAVVTTDQAYAGWALADEVLRMMTRSGPVDEGSFPSRLFTKDNVGSIQVTAAAQASGAWFGDGSYTTAFARLWGAG